MPFARAFALAAAAGFALAPPAFAKALLGEPEVDRASDQYDGLWCPAEQIQMYDGSFTADGPRATFVFVATNHSPVTNDWRHERIDNVVVVPAAAYAAHKHLPDSAFAAAFGCIEPNKNYFHFQDVAPGDLVFLEKFTAGPGPGWDMGDGAYANPGSSAPNALSLPVDTSGQSLGLGLDEVPTTVATTEITIDGLVAGEDYVVSTWTQCADASVGSDLYIQVYGTEFFSLTASAPDTGPGRGCAWGDADGDGDLDLFVTNFDAPSRYWRNDGRDYVDATASAGLTLTTRATAVSWVDGDDDGDPDLYVASHDANRYFRNAGNGSFTNATSLVLGDTRQTVCADWADVDNDGDLDAFLANVETDALLRNDGGKFVDVASGDLLGSGRAVGCSFADVDGDGDADLFVTYNAQPNELFVNAGGSFTKSTPALLAEPHALSNAAWADHDDDGDLDVLITTRGEGNRLCRNDGGGAFANVTPPALGAPGVIVEAAWADWDNDGRVDVYLANGNGPNRLFRNDGGGAFGVQPTGTVEDMGLATGTAWGDRDGDGDPDLCVVNFGANAMYRNEFGSENTWLHVDLEGTVSNRSGVGAKVYVTAGGVTRMREVGGDGGFRSQNSLTAEFGLGAATAADLVTVAWPSGITQTLAGVAANQRITIVEGGPSGSPAAVAPAVPRPVLGAPAPNPFRGSCAVAFDLPARADVELRVLDVRGRLVRVLEAGVREAGEHRAAWDGRDAAGHPAAPGLYFLELRGPGIREARKTVRITR